MKENIGTVVLGPHVLLVPYRKLHVLRYHEWMSDADLRELTASELLTVEEEYYMQQKWQDDEDKLTFILLARQPEDKLPVPTDLQKGAVPLLVDDPRVVALPMIGDVNLFLKGARPGGCERSQIDTIDDEDDFEVEVEVMIAEKVYRRRGLGLEALLLLFTYATGHPLTFLPPQTPSDLEILPYLEYIQAMQSPLSLTSIISPQRLVTRISNTNEPSIQLFEKLGFRIVRRVDIFQEVEMRWKGL